jgi:carbon monoxide dehydrogenase subunit G
MSLRFEHSFVVKSAPDRVWEYLTDPYRVAPALPGASITEKRDDGTYGGGITIKVGPVSARYRGTVRFESLDPVARTAAIVATGQDTSGRGGADMRMQSRLVENAAGETEVNVVSEVNVTGIMAQFGRGLIQDVSNQMLLKFTGAMRAELEKTGTGSVQPVSAGPGGAGAEVAKVALDTDGGAPSVSGSPAAAPPIEVFSFGGGLLARAAGRTMRRPLFWIVVAALAGLVYWARR